VRLIYLDASGKELKRTTSKEYDLSGTRSWTMITWRDTVPPTCMDINLEFGLLPGGGTLYARSASLTTW
jgi:hypothetical protein